MAYLMTETSTGRESQAKRFYSRAAAEKFQQASPYRTRIVLRNHVPAGGFFPTMVWYLLEVV